jgi:phosphate-selective porin OprO/OprP
MKQKVITTATIVASIMACGTAANNVSAQTSDPALNALVKKGILTEKEARDALAAAEADFKKKPGPAIEASWKDGLTFTSAGGLFKGKIGGQVHFDVVSFDRDRDLANSPIAALNFDNPASAYFRRARLAIEGELGTALPMFFKVQFDFAPAETEFKDVYVGIDKIPYVGRIQAGHFKEPMGLEMLTSSRFLSFTERSAPSEAFAPERNIGIMASDAKLDQHLTYAAGLFTDTGDSGKVASINSNYRVTARVTGLPWYDEESKGAHLLHVGLSGSYIDPGATNDLVQIRSRPESRPNARFVDTGGALVGADHAAIAGAEAALVFGPFSAQAEYFREWVDRANVGANLESPTFDGFYVFGSYFITGEHRNYKRSTGTFDRVIPHHNFTDGGLGAWEVLLRYSHTELNDTPVLGGRMNNITAGVNWYWNPNAKLQFNYINAKIDRGPTDGTLQVFQSALAFDF